MSYKHGLAVVFACAIASAIAWAATYPRFFSPRMAAHAGPSQTPDPPPASLALELAPLVDKNPLSWTRLSPQQREALAPFAAEWDSFSDERKRKWIKIAARFPKLSPEAKKRMQERMTQWVSMTPEQRRVARENYQVSKRLPPQARQKAWKAYQALPPEQKAHLAAIERKRRPTVVSAPPSGVKREIRGISPLAASTPAPSPNASAPGAAAPAQVPPASGAAPASTPLSPSEVPAVYRGA